MWGCVLRGQWGRKWFGFPCRVYATFQPLEVDVAVGFVLFEYDVSVLCNDRGLVPED